MKRRSFIGSVGLIPLSMQSRSFVGKNSEEVSFNNWDKVRKQFPLHNRRVYFNNGTFGPSPYRVLEALKDKFGEINRTAEYGHTNKAREILAEFIGAELEEISLTHNTTEGINIICQGLNLNSGDEVIISLQEHVGNALPWIYRSKKDGLVLKTFEPAGTAEETISRIEKLISKKTKVVAIPHITCTTGQRFPIKEIASLARKHNVFTAIDGAHGPGMLDLNMKELGVDFYASCCHKWMLGPGGTGFLYVKKELLDIVAPVFVGAYSDIGWSLYDNPPSIAGLNLTAHRYDYGTQSSAIYHAAAESALYHTNIGKAKIENRVLELATSVHDGIKYLTKKYKVLSPSEKSSRSGMVTFLPLKMDYKKCNNQLNKAGFRVRMVPESNLNAIRISTHIYNSMEEVNELIKALSKLE